MKYISYNRGTIFLPKHFREYDCSIHLGRIQETLRKKDRFLKLKVNMEITEWGDPLALLALGAMLYTINEYRSETEQQINVLLGEHSINSIQHSIFLKFIAEQGFIKAYGNFATFHFNNKVFNTKENIALLVSELSQFEQPVNYRNADCILANFIGVNDFRNDQDKLHNKVDELITEASERLIDSAYTKDPLTRDRLLQKIRKIFFEIISNSVDHAYPVEFQGQPLKGYVGVYARLRGELPNNFDEAREWRRLVEVERFTKNCPTINRFDPNPLAPWIEIFICDVGVGLLANLDEWVIPEYMKKETDTLELLKKDIKEGKVRDPLRTISKMLFSLPLTRIANRLESRSSVTGLLLLGIMLQQDGDFSRIYTGGEWVGNRHPWSTNFSTDGCLNVYRHANISKDYCSRGVWYAFSIQPEQNKLEYPQTKWIIPSQQEREQMI